MTYADYAPLIDTGLVLALALIVWAAYREMRNRKRAAEQSSQLSNSIAQPVKPNAFPSTWGA